MHKWLIYWLIFGLVFSCRKVFWFVFSLFPLANIVACAFLFMLYCPGIELYGTIYQNAIKPLFFKWEKHIDRYLEMAKEEVADQAIKLIKKVKEEQ